VVFVPRRCRALLVLSPEIDFARSGDRFRLVVFVRSLPTADAVRRTSRARRRSAVNVPLSLPQLEIEGIPSALSHASTLA